mmetsp:Transcript_27875/g.73700  ORF Transcript_27875/g.73700 Transcript_27875/m.73700 type:complete len:230 (+) Transcript_27875:79-768(+)
MGAGRAGSRGLSPELPQPALRDAILVSPSSAKACTERLRNRAISAVPGKDTEAKELPWALATSALVAPCFAKKRRSSASSTSCGSPARMRRSARACRSSLRSGLWWWRLSRVVLRGMRKPQQLRMAPEVCWGLASTTSLARHRSPRAPPSPSGRQNVTWSPAARRMCPQASAFTSACFLPVAVSRSSLTSVPLAPAVAGRTMVPANFGSFRMCVVCGKPSALRRTRKCT